MLDTQTSYNLKAMSLIDFITKVLKKDLTPVEIIALQSFEKEKYFAHNTYEKNDEKENESKSNVEDDKWDELNNTAREIFNYIRKGIKRDDWFIKY